MIMTQNFVSLIDWYVIVTWLQSYQHNPLLSSPHSGEVRREVITPLQSEAAHWRREKFNITPYCPSDLIYSSVAMIGPTQILQTF